MKASDIRSKYLKFFESRGHAIIPAAPIIPPDDPTTLFTSSGMQQMVPYLKGEPHSMGKRIVDSQPSLRTEDIEEVGDNRHTCMFEMLGNWSLGDYFKSEQLPWVWEFFTKEIGLDPTKLYVTLFEGNDLVEKDLESYEIWKSLGVADDRIFYYPGKKNWWSRAGTPDQMPVGEIGGPTSEVFFEFVDVQHDPMYGDKCHPNCDCGRFLEIGNSVFMAYEKVEGGLKPLPAQNVDFGGGLERIAAAINNNPDIFKIDMFEPIIKSIEKSSDKKYEGVYMAPMRVIADLLSL
jgi:alanyl-tRNA synthetase